MASIRPFIGAQIGWGAADSVKKYLSSKMPASIQKINVVNEVGKRAVDFTVSYVVPEILGTYIAPLSFLGFGPQLVFSISYNGVNTAAHVGIAAKKYLEGNQLEAKNHVKAAVKFGYKAAFDATVYYSIGYYDIADQANLAKVAADVIAPKFLREKTKAVLSFIDNKVIGKKAQNDEDLFNATVRKLDKEFKLEERALKYLNLLDEEDRRRR